MKAILKPALALGLAGVFALGSVTTSQARIRPWVATGIGLAAGAAIASAAAANPYYYGPAYYYGPGYVAYPYGRYYAAVPAYTAPAYEAYAYAPGFLAPNVNTRYHGYDSNYAGSWKERQLEGHDY
jgi:hypothetical protein